MVLEKQGASFMIVSPTMLSTLQSAQSLRKKIFSNQRGGWEYLFQTFERAAGKRANKMHKFQQKEVV